MPSTVDDASWAESHARRVRAQQRLFNRATQWLNVYLMLDRRRKQACIKKGKPYTENARIRKRRASVRYHADMLKRIRAMPYVREQESKKMQRIDELSRKCRQIKATLTTDNVEKVQSALAKLRIEYMELTECDPMDSPTRAMIDIEVHTPTLRRLSLPWRFRNAPASMATPQARSVTVV